MTQKTEETEPVGPVPGAAPTSSTRRAGGGLRAEYRKTLTGSRIPHAIDTELEVASSVAGYYHHGPKPDPALFYDQRLAMIVRAFVDHGDRIRYRGLEWLIVDGEPRFAYRYDGLREVLTELGAGNPVGLEGFTGFLAADAPVTHAGDISVLERYAAARARLIDLEAERAAIEALP